MKCAVVTVTPELAKQWLKQNAHNNRNIRDSDVSKFARDMRNGNWKLTHQGIAFNALGDLIDGQHRLWAVIESGVSVPMHVWTEVPEETVQLIDSGTARTASDSLGFLTEDHAYRHKIVISVFRHLIRMAYSYPQKYKFTPTELYMLMSKYDNIAQWVYYMFNHKHMYVKHSGYFCSLLLAIANGESVKDVLAFDTVVVDGTPVAGNYFHGAAVQFRFWYSGSERPSGVGKIGPVVERCTKDLYKFIHNKKSCKGHEYTLDVAKLDQLNEILKDCIPEDAKAGV